MEYNSENEISLLDKGKHGLLHMVFSRLGLVVLLLVLQIGIIVHFYIAFRDYSPYYYSVSLILSFIIFVQIINNSNIEPTSKITWLALIAAMPLFGAFMFLYTKQDIGFRALKFQASRILKSTEKAIPQDSETMEKLQAESPETASLAQYIARTGCHPVYENTDVRYFPLGEDKFRRMLEELEKAEKFIFMEYYIVDEGHMWGRILDVLSRKAKEGVTILFMYDGNNEFLTLPRGYDKKLQQLGIQCKVFAPATPFVSTHYNYRDHRKILVIDNKVAFTGGINLADEYINRYEKYGHWKDTAIMLKGEAVKSFTLMFLQMWNISGKTEKYEDYITAPCDQYSSNGYVIPYGDSPLDHYRTGEQVYLDIINRANRYVYIMSPYLILDGELESALKFAAQRGVDVKMILPGIPDKKVPYAVAKTHFSSLTGAGVKIYTYDPGFVHAKVFISDDIKAVVGTVNLDYRSLYHHFECAAYLYKTDCIPEIVQDFHETLEKCSAVTAQTIRKEKLSTRLIGRLVKIVSPLM